MKKKELIIIKHNLDPFWKHATTPHHLGFTGMKTVGIDLFDDEGPGHISIYVRFKNGKRWPARTIGRRKKCAGEVLAAWIAYKCGGNISKVHDFRKKKTPELLGLQ